MPTAGKILIIAGAMLVVAAAAAATVHIYQRRKKQSAENADDAVLADGIARHAQLYDGLYEGIYQAVVRDDFTDLSAYREWRDRTAHIEDDAEFVQLFARCFDGQDSGETFKRLLGLVEKAGIVRRDETELAVSASARKAYLYLGEGEPVDGMICKVMKPCWEYLGQIVEQGVLMKKEG